MQRSGSRREAVGVRATRQTERHAIDGDGCPADARREEIALAALILGRAQACVRIDAGGSARVLDAMAAHQAAVVEANHSAAIASELDVSVATVVGRGLACHWSASGAPGQRSVAAFREGVRTIS